MSANERTPAIERAAEENPRAYLEWNTAFMSGKPIEPASVYVSRRTLAAALDVEEMARAGHADSCCTDFDGCDLTFDRNVARAHVAAILGSDS